MVKVCHDLFPVGSYKRQRGDGYMMNEYLQQNLDICCKKIAKDMDFVFLVSGSGMVRNGKSAFTQQMGTYITWKVNGLHKVNNTFSLKNIVFKSEDLLKRALSLPKYSVLVLDEGDDLTENYWSKLSKVLRRFFRKCGQLNLFLFLLIPDFFELKTSLALTRSICLLNVYFWGEFDRGYFAFYDFETKKQLYIKGKKYRNYRIVPPLFNGRFVPLYTVGDKEYREKKKKDLDSDDDIVKSEPRMIMECWKKIIKNLDDLKRPLTIEQKSEITELSKRSVTRYKAAMKEEEEIILN